MKKKNATPVRMVREMDEGAFFAMRARLGQQEKAIEVLERVVSSLRAPVPIPMRLRCPECNSLHLDEGEFATKPHHTHCCQSCGMVWRPALVPTVGVRFLPGFKNEEARDG